MAIVACFYPRVAQAQTPPSSIPIDAAAAKASMQWMVERAICSMPRSFDGNKDWGHSKKIWAGVKIRMDGLKLKTHRRFREVEQGRWVKYEVTLPEAGAAGALEAQIDDVSQVIDSLTGSTRWRIASTIVVPMKFSARVQRWNLGVRLFSVTVEGTMKIRMTSTTTMGIYPDYTRVLPDLVIDPAVESADLRLQRFEVDRVSHVGGDAAEAWGEVLQEVLVERFVKKENDRLVQRLNKAIDKQRDDLRVSTSDWIGLLATQTAADAMPE